MKISNYLIFNVVTIFILAVLSTGLRQTNASLTYQENSSPYNLTGAQTHILEIKHYNDNSGTTVVRVARTNYFNLFTYNYCYEQRLLLRVIQANGSVIEINYVNSTEIQDINYCFVASNIKDPINFYPLFDQYILVTYTHATNTSDNTTYTDHGMVLDWNGNVISNLDFGQSYLLQGTIWIPNEYIVNNITPQKGFLRLSATTVNGTGSFKWAQYQHNGNGIFSLLQNDTVSSVDLTTSFQVTVIATLNNGYAIVYANTTNSPQNSDPLSAQLTAKAGIYAILLGYNQTITSQRTILYEMTTSNLTFISLYCSVDYVFIGHTCILSAQQRIFTPTNVNVTYSNVTTTTLASATTTTAVQVITPVNVTVVDNTAPPNITTNSFYIKIRFLSTGSVISLSSIFSNSIEITRSLPHGGYAYISRQFSGLNINFSFSLYDEYDKISSWTFPQQPILSNFDGAFDILQNNTMLVALNDSTTTWSLLSIDLPLLAPPPQIDSGYGNLQISATYPQINDSKLPLNTDTINITYYNRISLSDGNLTIYQTINNTNIPRQRIISRTCDTISKCIPLNTVLNLKVFTCTFNDPGGQYFIVVDNNFVMSDIRGKLRLTISGSIYFQALNDSERNEFFITLINELLVIIPTEQGRLDSTRLFQKDPSNTDQILISLIVYEMKSGDKKNATSIQNDLNLLIINKVSTGISLFGNMTKLLDNDYGFQTSMSILDFFKLYETKFVLLVVGIALFLILFIIARVKSPKSQNFVVFQIGITIFRIATVTIFTFTDAKTVPNLFLPSMVFLIAPIAFNLLVAFLIIYYGGEEFQKWFANYGRTATSFALLSGANIDVILILKSYLMELELFNSPLSPRALITVFWASCVDIFLQDVPQFIIQIFYILSSVEYDIIPLFALIASGLSVLSNILSKLFFIKFKKYSPYLVAFYDHHAVESESPDEQKSNSDDYINDDDSY
ncbi:13901_t:CDS:2 [Dentiscutata erythropus]|uniref:13901_t:CDS:1 n=1 Tax=Dentiscutata erythropus TaxID=1348616 RepID=A0A9N9FPK1_9GLOM|nr:13901_t:CDS:2 [Dentiscutata erythropus]